MPERDDLVPRILFPGLPGDQTNKARDLCAAPSIDMVTRRYKYCIDDGECLGLPALLTTVSRAKDIRVLDPYFDKTSVEVLRCSLRANNTLEHLTILTGRTKEVADCESELREIVDESAAKGNRPKIEVKLLRNGWDKKCHDRFAVLDGELWHFGANVGGHHAALNACSRGWPSHKIKLHVLFDKIFEAC